MKHLVCAFAIFITLSGCSAVGVVQTNDPAKKIEQAASLFSQQDRPLPAERLIQEAADIYRSTGNDVGLAEAYRTYAFFFRSQAVEHWGWHYRQYGFLDKSATFDNRYEKSIEYFDHSKALWEKAGRHDWTANIELNKGFTFMLLKQPENACLAYDASLRANAEFPPKNVQMPKGFASYVEFVEDFKRKAACKA
jgi:tetratricopeptide (TPR) repeat protein